MTFPIKTSDPTLQAICAAWHGPVTTLEQVLPVLVALRQGISIPEAKRLIAQRQQEEQDGDQKVFRAVLTHPRN